MSDLGEKMAAKARHNALSMECKKDGLAQLQDGSWVLKLKVSPDDMPVGLMQAAMGTIYMVALVEVTDQSEPKAQSEKAKTPAGKVKKTLLSQQSALLCKEPRFWRFLIENYPLETHPAENGDEETTILAVRHVCEVNSRSEFDTSPQAAARWRTLYGEYEAWLRTA